MSLPTTPGLVSIHQIEITSRCNLKCVYCTHPNMPRVKEDMSERIFDRALTWVDHFYRVAGTQDSEVNLAGIGESTIHPKLVEFVAETRRRFPGARILFASNGLVLDEDLAARLAPYQPKVTISMHVPLKAAKAIEIAKRHGIYDGAGLDAATNPVDWAGQVAWTKPGFTSPCRFLHFQEGFVSADGRILTCCYDATGDSCVGHVNDEPSALPMKRWKLCDTCHLIPPSWA